MGLASKLATGSQAQEGGAPANVQVDIVRWLSSLYGKWRSTARPRNSNIAPNSNHALSFVSRQALIAAANVRSMLYVQDVVTSMVVESTAAAIPFTDPSGGVSIAVAGVATVQPYQQQEVAQCVEHAKSVTQGASRACLCSLSGLTMLLLSCHR